MTAPRRKLFLILGIPLGAVAVLAIALAFLNSSPARSGMKDELVSIDRGESLSEISRDLQRQGYIRFAPLLEALARVRGTQGDFKAGWYRIPAGSSTRAIHN